MVSAGGPGACAILSDTSVRCWSIPNPLGTNSYVSAFFPATPSSVRGLQTGISHISVGQHFACAVRAVDNRVYCWGRNDFGQLGRGALGTPTDPELDASVAVSNLSAKQVTAGTTHACAIAADNTVFCWGDPSSGQLGTGTNATAPIPTPQLTVGITNAVNISASAGFTCATLSDRTARCWGQNLPLDPNAGTLGVGLLFSAATLGSIEFVKPGAVNVPLPVKGLTGAVFISTGATHACASGFGGMVRCWGSNSMGQLTTGNTDSSVAPVP
jgi:alpha-tubulin suppressor-like RCC1 family protein